MGEIVSRYRVKEYKSTLDAKIESLTGPFERECLKRGKEEMKQYRQGYPGKVDDEEKKDNYLFYTNQIKCRPGGYLVDDILTTWYGDYDKLDNSSGYIQWLFPIMDISLDNRAQELQTHEAQEIQLDPGAMRRVILAYRMMLDSFGLVLTNEETGELNKAIHWEERFHKLNNSHMRERNYCRITRMLKSLGELGLEKYKKPFLEFIIQESLCKNTLPNTLISCVHYWIPSLRDDHQRFIIETYAEYLASNPVHGLKLDLNRTYTRPREPDADSGRFSDKS